MKITSKRKFKKTLNKMVNSFNYNLIGFRFYHSMDFNLKTYKGFKVVNEPLIKKGTVYLSKLQNDEIISCNNIFNHSITKDFSSEIPPMVVTMSFKPKKELKYKLTDEQLNEVMLINYRKHSQIKMLFQLVDGNYKKLLQLEQKLKSLFYCPSTKIEVNKILKSK